jgi:hypothetical protein
MSARERKLVALMALEISVASGCGAAAAAVRG